MKSFFEKYFFQAFSFMKAIFFAVSFIFFQDLNSHEDTIKFYDIFYLKNTFNFCLFSHMTSSNDNVIARLKCFSTLLNQMDKPSHIGAKIN